VQLPDEYDQIYHDLRPFKAISPSDLARRNEKAAQLPDTYTLEVKEGSLKFKPNFDVGKLQGGKARMEGQVALLKPIAKHVPDFKAVYSVHDTAKILVARSRRAELISRSEEDDCE